MAVRKTLCFAEKLMRSWGKIDSEDLVLRCRVEMEMSLVKLFPTQFGLAVADTLLFVHSCWLMSISTVDTAIGRE